MAESAPIVGNDMVQYSIGLCGFLLVSRHNCLHVLFLIWVIIARYWSKTANFSCPTEFSVPLKVTHAVNISPLSLVGSVTWGFRRLAVLLRMKDLTLFLAYLPTAIGCVRLSVHPFVTTLSFKSTDILTWVLCVYVGHDHSSPGIETQDNR